MLRLSGGLEVHQVRLPYTNIYGGRDSVNAYFLTNGTDAVLIDCGKYLVEHRHALEAHWRQLGSPRVRQVLLSHGHTDHVGNARFIGSLFQANVYISATDVSVFRRAHPEWTPEVQFEDGATITTSVAEVSALHTPGHSPGHNCFMISGSRVLFSGDMVLPHIPTLIARPDGNMNAYMRSLARLGSLAIDQIAPGHGPFIENAKARVATLLAHRIRREGEIIGILRTGARTLEELTDILYSTPTESSVRHRAGSIMVDAHLHKLEAAGRARQHNGRWQLAARTQK
ncbi:MAG: MBL fold metallo-hydrolase [Acidimicrobiia bacterium]